eukprot:CAMPEP_0170100096 /NCGR_PEP_ID=MMETSP0020_2-20130122/1441_1 /TAXON_ID=98059 /ORGANISM="Dinobryon sp., Strain UTEXLB2267" /LENGTH=89 /DNA_ID=CAMNT_0010322899 /DNA_START=1 /DNA_END=270 /DNA_ORIENTATION=-
MHHSLHFIPLLRLLVLQLLGIDDGKPQATEDCDCTIHDLRQREGLSTPFMIRPSSTDRGLDDVSKASFFKHRFDSTNMTSSIAMGSNDI